MDVKQCLTETTDCDFDSDTLTTFSDETDSEISSGSSNVSNLSEENISVDEPFNKNQEKEAETDKPKVKTEKPETVEKENIAVTQNIAQHFTTNQKVLREIKKRLPCKDLTKLVGTWKDLDKLFRGRQYLIELNHLPPLSSYKGVKFNMKITRENTPVIAMAYEDHRNIQSTRFKAYRKILNDLAKLGDWKKVIEMEIVDIQSFAGSNYNLILSLMLDELIKIGLLTVEQANGLRKMLNLPFEFWNYIFGKSCQVRDD